MASVKYQVFISSTYEDLKEQRDQIVRAVLEMGHIPVGMEMFSAGDDTQWQLIQRQIESSDYYVVLVAHRYGSMDGPISYTEKEYDYATSLGLPTLGFIIDDATSWSPGLIDTEPAIVAALAAFKQKVRTRIVSKWTSTEDLHGKVAIALMKQFAATPRDGWIRASEATPPQTLAELARLSRENGELRDALRTAQVKDAADSDQEKSSVISILRSNDIKVRFWYNVDNKWSESVLTKSLYDLFRTIAPILIDEQKEDDIVDYISDIWNPDRDKALRSSWPIPQNTYLGWIADMAALGLVEPSRKKHPVADKNQYLSLTDFGRQTYTAIRRARLEAGLPTQDLQTYSDTEPERARTMECERSAES